MLLTIEIKNKNAIMKEKNELKNKKEIGNASVEMGSFQKVYPIVNNIFIDGGKKEILDFKMSLSNPYCRCSDGSKNIFEILLNSVHMVLGSKGKNFIEKKDYDLKPSYGYRLRHYGVGEEERHIGSNLSIERGADQVVDSIRILSSKENNLNSVLNIWNQNIDLGKKKCPSVIFIAFKIEKNKLITNVNSLDIDFNREFSNDVFMFGFLSEIISSVLGVELGTQTHNIQVLQYLKDDKINTLSDKRNFNIHLDSNSVGRKIDFNFLHTVPTNRFVEIEYILRIIESNSERIINGEKPIREEVKILLETSNYFYKVYKLIELYLNYIVKVTGFETIEKKKESVSKAIQKIDSMRKKDKNFCDWDIYILAKNYFQSFLDLD